MYPQGDVDELSRDHRQIYATSEERKQRNRQAQAAFRERRTEYIKQLETTIKRHEEQLQNLQQSHRSAADECLMLRYKNSLLERILLEKGLYTIEPTSSALIRVGIDVQAELRRKEIAPSGRLSQPLPQPAPIHRPVSSRHRHVHRMSSGSASMLPKSATFGSPQVKSSPSSQVSSPTSGKSPGFGSQGGINLSHPGFQAQQPPQQQHSLQQPQLRTSTYPGLTDAATRPGLQPIAPDLRDDSRAHWPSPFRTHNEQLGMSMPIP